MKVAPATNHHGGGFKDPLLFKEAELRQRASRPSSDHLCESVVAFPPKSDTGYARENKIDDVSAVLRYGWCRPRVSSASTAGTTPYPRVVE